MELPQDIFLKGIDAFLLIFIRMTGLFVITPIFGRRNIPVYLKIGFSLLLSLILINVIEAPELDEYDNILQFTGLAAKEFIVGITLGFVSYLVFTAIYLAGQLIDMLIGFGMVSVFDPMSNIQVPVTANLYFILSMLVFLAVNGHHYLITALFDSFRVVPLGSAAFGVEVVNDIVRVVGYTFSIGFRIAAPITAAILLSDVVLGILSKSVPQLNVFVVGMPLKIILGIAVMVITIPAFISLLEALFNGMNSEMFNFMKDLVPE